MSKYCDFCLSDKGMGNTWSLVMVSKISIILQCLNFTDNFKEARTCRNLDVDNIDSINISKKND